MQHDDCLWCSDVLTDSDVVGQCCLLTAFRHVNHGDVCIIELIEHVRLSKVQPLETDLMKINSQPEIFTSTHLCTSFLAADYLP